MKKGSDNYRESSIQDVIRILLLKGLKVIVYEPLINANNFYDSKIVNNFEEFSEKCDLIIANRINNQLQPVKNKVFSRDIFNKD